MPKISPFRSAIISYSSIEHSQFLRNKNSYYQNRNSTANLNWSKSLVAEVIVVEVLWTWVLQHFLEYDLSLFLSLLLFLLNSRLTRSIYRCLIFFGENCALHFDMYFCHFLNSCNVLTCRLATIQPLISLIIYLWNL